MADEAAVRRLGARERDRSLSDFVVEFVEALARVQHAGRKSAVIQLKLNANSGHLLVLPKQAQAVEARAIQFFFLPG